MGAKELIDEFLISWNSGASASSIEKSLITRGYDRGDVEKARIVFEQWLKSKKSWGEVKKSFK
jgi:hypothetical protein